MTSDTIFVQGCGIISLDPMIGDLLSGDIHVADGRIVAVAASLPVPAGAEVIDGRALIAMPGFVDGHRHLWETVIRNALPTEDIDGYFQRVNLGFAAALSPEDAYLATLVGALGALDAGITGMFDWSHVQTTPDHTAACIAGLRDAGIRATFGFGMPGRRDRGHQWPGDLLRLQREEFASDGLVTLALATRGPEHADYDVARAEFTLVKDAGLIVTAHTGINNSGTRHQIERFGRDGLLGPHVNLVHCNTLSAAEWALIGESGTTVSITPSCEMQMGQGVPPIQAALDVGCKPSIGVDVETSVPGDMWTQMRVLYALQRGNALEARASGGVAPALMGVDDLLECATLAGARACGVADRSGSLTPGKQADLILLRADMLNVMPVNDMRSAVALGMDARNVDSVFVAGRAVKRDGRMLGVDLPALAGKLYESRDRVFHDSGQPLPSPVARFVA